MQTAFLERHTEDILGAYSCFDRIIIQGALPDIAHADAITQWFFWHDNRGFNLFDKDDEQVFMAVAQGQTLAFGFRNANPRARPGKTSAQISRICQRLRYHGLIKKAVSSYKYHLTALAELIVAASLKLKEMTLIPLLRGQLLATCS